MKQKNLWIPILLLMVVGGSGVMWMGVKTYQGAPPIPNLVGSGETLASKDDILAGQAVFQKYALMEYGSMFGDGGARGPDFTALSLHEICTSMKAFYVRQHAAIGTEPTAAVLDGIDARVKRELKTNRYQAANNTLPLTEGQVHAFHHLVGYYRNMFLGEGANTFRPKDYITDETELEQLATFFFWGGWVCGAERPGSEASYTHNWPYDPEAGNLPGTSILLWSVLGSMALILGVGLVLFYYGRYSKVAGWHATDTEQVATGQKVDEARPFPTQRATYKFFAVAAILFLLQVLAGVLTIHDFVGFTNIFGIDLQALLPLTITRSWHIQVSVLWIATCWFAASIFILPRITGREPRHQLRLVNILFWMLVVVVAGTVTGGLLGPKGVLGDFWRWIGNQGWEFVELGKVYQVLLFAAMVLWVVIIFRGVKPVLKQNDFFTLPHWLLYTTGAISVLFLSSFVAGPKTNFVIADFWRWMVIHMWAECFFEVFTTVIVAYFLVVMGLVAKRTAQMTVFLAVLLFLGSGFLGIAHNFYWNAKPSGTLAIGSVFSTMQVIPLILLTYEAWRFRRMPLEALKNGGAKPRLQNFGLAEAFLFLIAVNFWNFLGAGVFGFIINLPIVNYYEHGTYLTVNHGHAALMGVYGNLSIASILFCSRYLVRPDRWNGRLLRISFWSINIGLMLMVLLDTFPAGIAQLIATLDGGLWAARSQAFIEGSTFQMLTWMRVIGGALFLLGGVVPLVWFMQTRWNSLKPVRAVPGSDGLGAPATPMQTSLDKMEKVHP